MKKILLGIILSFSLVSFGKDVTEIQSVDGGQRGQITPAAAGGGGGGSGTVTTINGAGGVTASTPDAGATYNLNTDSSIVKTNGTQTISGAKTFTDNATFNGTISGLTTGNIVTNIVGAGGNTVTGQGTAILTVTGGGGSGAAAVTNAANFFTSGSINTFNTNVFITAGGIAVGTNATTGVAYFSQPKGTLTNSSLVYIDDRGTPGLGSAEIRMGDVFSATGNGYLRMVHSTLNGDVTLSIDGVNNGVLRLDGSASGAHIALVPDQASATIDLTTTATTFGQNSSHAYTWNGINHSFPNGANFGSGVLTLPATATGTITNGTSFTVNKNLQASNSSFGFISGLSSSTLTNLASELVTGSLTSLNTGTFSNLVVNTTDGTTYLNSGTNLLIRIIANGAAGTIQSEGIFTSRTNALTGTHTINTIYTNNSMRATVSTGILLPTAAATISAASFWTISGGVTNWGPIVMSDAGLASGAITNSCGGEVDPNALYMWTNVAITAGTPSTVPAYSREKRW